MVLCAMAKLRKTPFCQGVTATQDFKAFLRRHPEIRGRSRTEKLMDDIRLTMESIGRQFINDGQAGPHSMERFRMTMQCALDRMVTERRILNFDIHDATTPNDQLPVIEVCIQPTNALERIVVDVCIKP